MKKNYLLFIFVFYAVYTTAQQQSKQPAFSDASQLESSEFSYKIIDSPNQTFGYDIYAANKLIIHQPVIPAISGHEGFKTKSDAIKVAELVIIKIKKGKMPPSVTPDELKKMKVIK